MTLVSVIRVFYQLSKHAVYLGQVLQQESLLSRQRGSPGPNRAAPSDEWAVFSGQGQKCGASRHRRSR